MKTTNPAGSAAEREARANAAAHLNNAGLTTLAAICAAQPAEPANPHALDARELATVLAALRCYQQVSEQCGGDIPDDLQDIADCGGEIEPLEIDEIDELCERLNCEPASGLSPGATDEEIEDYIRRCAAQGADRAMAALRKR